MSFHRIEDIEDLKQECNSSEHNPPTHIYLQPGLWEWSCPNCQKTKIVRVPKITM